MNRQQLDKYYDKFMDEIQETSDDTRKSYENMCHWFDEYVSAVTEEIFKQAFQYGYEQGMKDADMRKTA